jgi:hypothetical protein
MENQLLMQTEQSVDKGGHGSWISTLDFGAIPDPLLASGRRIFGDLLDGERLDGLGVVARVEAILAGAYLMALIFGCSFFVIRLIGR